MNSLACRMLRQPLCKICVYLINMSQFRQECKKSILRSGKHTEVEGKLKSDRLVLLLYFCCCCLHQVYAQTAKNKQTNKLINKNHKKNRLNTSGHPRLKPWLTCWLSHLTSLKSSSLFHLLCMTWAHS